MKINLSTFNKRKDEKLINCQVHDSLPLLIWNYTPQCQFSQKWDEVTMMCRGLITDREGNIIARPFKKFFNIGEQVIRMPKDNPIVYPKWDGSLGIQYYDGEKVCIATRGSFKSDQALWATNRMMMFKRRDFDEGFTYLYEIIYPENRIVVDYGGRKELVLLAIINTETGEEHPYAQEYVPEKLNISATKRVTYTDLEQLVEDAKKLGGNEEGYVLHWPYNDNLRLKIKGEEYVRLHRLITSFSTKSIWEALKNGDDISEIMDRVPDEFYDWVKEKKAELNKRFAEIYTKSVHATHEIRRLHDNRKDQAMHINRLYKDIAPYIFSLLDEKDPTEAIWRRLKPKHELPFKKDIDAL